MHSYKLQTDNISFKKGSNNNKYKTDIKAYNKNQEKEKSKENERNSIQKFQNIKYNFNVCEIIIASSCKCCLWKNLGIKNKINEKAINILYNTLDIVCFVRNQLLFNIINKTILDDHIKTIINLLCRPIVSINDNKDKNELPDFYKRYKEDDFNKFSEELIQLTQKPKKKDKEKKLIFLSNIHLKDMFINNSFDLY